MVCDTVLADPDEVDGLLGKPRDAIHACNNAPSIVWTEASSFGLLQGILCAWPMGNFLSNMLLLKSKHLSDEALVELVMNESWERKKQVAMTSLVQWERMHH